jgi:hypothetical protein
MDRRQNRGAAKRTYVEDSGSGSDGLEEEVVQSKRVRVQRRERLPLDVSGDEDDANVGTDVNVEETDVGTEKCRYEAGHIMSVYVENFMCHRKFFTPFGHHVQFITGRNGSGKSAIVAAIQLCLGSSARQTGRGSNIGKYVREGSENPAVLKVSLYNEGPDAYKPEVYGNRITVKRVINKASSTYHLLDENGVVRSLSKVL